MTTAAYITTAGRAAMLGGLMFADFRTALRRRVSLVALVVACGGCVETSSTVQGPQCSSSLNSGDGSVQSLAGALDEGNGIVSQLRLASVGETGASSKVVVFGNCATGTSASIGLWGFETTGATSGTVDQYVSDARRQGLLNDFAMLIARAQQSGMPTSQMGGGFKYDPALSCACQLAAEGKLPKARH